MNIAEADDVERAMARKQMDEVYRTVLGGIDRGIASVGKIPFSFWGRKEVLFRGLGISLLQWPS